MGLPHIPIGELWVKFPIYWVPQRVGRRQSGPNSALGRSFQFIGFPSEWGAVLWGEWRRAKEGFQFIGFPSEWGELRRLRPVPGVGCVSNLLGSPASGEWLHPLAELLGLDQFPIYWVPQRVGSFPTSGLDIPLTCFQFIGFPSEWGDTPIETRMARACQGAFASISPNRYTLYCF